jgi:glycosyltransferase involved in cell wall biosynthesis
MTPGSSPRLLMIGYVWPETNASAAGLRDWALLEQFRAAGFEVHYASPAKENAFSAKLQAMGVPIFSCEANDPKFDEFIGKLQPSVVLFDRFVIEEQFGWRVEESCPDAIRVLDTQDLHFLRRAREAALREGWALERIQEASEEMILKFAKEDLLRELSAIYRSDLTLVISSFEMKLLLQRYKIPQELLLLQRLSYSPKSFDEYPAFDIRKNFVSIGNFRHPPNVDAILWLTREIWPEIRNRLPNAEIHLYGAYPSREMMALSNSKTGIIVKGPVENQYETLGRYRVLLAPLRFGAGIKGKIADAWSVGTAVVTTPIGAEGMVDLNGSDGNWPGEIADHPVSFASSAADLYTRESLWEEHRQLGAATLARSYSPAANARVLIAALENARVNRDEFRKQNLIGAMLRHNLHRSTKYFSRWIELKQSLKK